MPSYLNFDSTKSFRNFILGKTLQVPNGPQTFTSSTYELQKLSDIPNIDTGPVDKTRTDDLIKISNTNTYKPANYFIRENIDTLPRTNNLSLYFNGGSPYFVADKHNLISIMATKTYDTESELFKFAAKYIREDKGGPVLTRIAYNTDRAINGKIRLLDALNGNTATALNILTGREPLVEMNNKITVASTLIGKGIDFLQTVSGTQLPFSEIPGDYLSNPRDPINYRPEARTEFGKIVQDVTGVLGSLVGIERRPKLSRKPSDLLIEYMGQGPKQALFDSLTFNRYAPNYTTSARSQQSSKLFGFVDKFAQGVKNILGVEAPAGQAYIGDDRANDVKFAMGDFNDNQVRSTYYLSLMFDEVSAQLFHKTKNVTEGGQIGGKLTWYSKNTKNKLGENNEEYSGREQTNLEDSLSTKYVFREDSILGKTQQILNTLPTNGSEMRSHVANVIDQTSRVFRDGDVMMSRGSAVKYTNKFSGEESGIEYCRVWTKDRPYFNYSDTMKRTNMIRKFDGSVMGGNSRVWNLNMAPMSNGRKSFDNSTNIKDGQAKKYMFSIENLAWKSSTLKGFTVQDLPICERGSNGGRVMWFPPYDLKISEQNSAKWEENSFLGRPEPIYTYQNTNRTGTISFKVVVDHPSILNLLVREHFKGMSDEEADNYINSFFAGCQDIDFYDLVRKYTNLDTDDIKRINEYLNAGKEMSTIMKYKYSSEEVEEVKPDTGETPTKAPEPFSLALFFPNDIPSKNGKDTTKGEIYSSIQPSYYSQKTSFNTDALIDFTRLSGDTSAEAAQDIKTIFKLEKSKITDFSKAINLQLDKLNTGFEKLNSNYTEFNTKIADLKKAVSGNTIEVAEFKILSSASEVANDDYNFLLGMRRAHSLILDILTKLKGDVDKIPDFNWPSEEEVKKNVKDGLNDQKLTFTFEKLGYKNNVGKLIINFTTEGENAKGLTNVDPDGKLDCKTVIKTQYGLKITTPNAFYCRQSSVKFSAKTLSVQKPPSTQKIKIPKITKEPGEPEKTYTPKPPIDIMKRIVTKTLSECFYFKKLEEDSPLAFTSLKEKLKYFHPAFHSTTPEGLNSRLTFLLQCVRPGNTIPIKGIADVNDLNARNTSFGPPPICVLRIGDFYNSKIVIRDINITYDDSTWDLNPEGIGVQPMIANVTMQVSFIGGQGLERPVEKLQNALSSNFFANTEIYDERSQSTATLIDGKPADQFTKEFIAELQKKPEYQLEGDKDNKPKVNQGLYIGTGILNSGLDYIKIDYTSFIDTIFSSTESYINLYKSSYNEVVKKYGKKVSSIFFHNRYKTVTGITINTSTTTTDTLPLLGATNKNANVNFYSTKLKIDLDGYIDNNNVTNLLGFNKVITSESIDWSNENLRTALKSIVNETIGVIPESSSLKKLEDSRNKVIKLFEKVNFLVKNEFDGKVNGVEFTSTTLSGFTGTSFYNQYSNIVDYFKNKHDEFNEDLDTSFDFVTDTLNDNIFVEIISILLQGKKETITKLYEENSTKEIADEIGKIMDKLIEIPKEKNFRMGKFPIKKSTSKIEYDVDVTDYIVLDEIKQSLMDLHNSEQVKFGTETFKLT
jgi:hypothetical protein